MFDFDCGEDLTLVAQTARSFAEDALAPKLRDSEAARAVDGSVRDAFDQIGLAGLELPEALGGADMGALARVLVNEELGAADPGAALALDPLGPALYALLDVGGEDAVRDVGGPVLEGDGARAVLVTTADASLDITNASVTGFVPWVPADDADLLVILSADGALAVREGIQSTPVRGSGLRAAGAAELRLEAAPIAGRWENTAGAARALARARLYIASLLVGVLRQANAFSREYALERVAFGRPIAHHQALAFLIIDMQAAVDCTRLLVQEAAWHVDAGLPCEVVAAAAYAEAIEASRFVGPNGVQILGGHGFMQDFPVEKHMREARALGLMLGGVDAARETAGQALCAGEPPVALSHGERA